MLEAAVIARPDPRWVERPMTCVVRVPGSSVQAADLLRHLEPLVARWWLPDEIVFLDDLPKTGTGTLSKVALRSSMQRG